MLEAESETWIDNPACTEQEGEDHDVVSPAPPTLGQFLELFADSNKRPLSTKAATRAAIANVIKSVAKQKAAAAKKKKADKKKAKAIAEANKICFAKGGPVCGQNQHCNAHIGTCVVNTEHAPALKCHEKGAPPCAKGTYCDSRKNSKGHCKKQTDIAINCSMEGASPCVKGTYCSTLGSCQPQTKTQVSEGILKCTMKGAPTCPAGQYCHFHGKCKRRFDLLLPKKKERFAVKLLTPVFATLKPTARSRPTTLAVRVFPHSDPHIDNQHQHS